MKYPKIKKRFEYILRERGITARELAEKSGVNETSISQYVNGRHAPSNVSSAKMAGVLGVDPLWLMGFDVQRVIKIGEEEARSGYEMTLKYLRLSPRDQRIIDQMIDTMLEGRQPSQT